jgi:thioredoxin 1
MQRDRVLRFLVLTISLLAATSAWTQSKSDKSKANDDIKAIKPLVTFIELGSVKCIPCREMQPVMAAVEKKYGDQITVVFHDVWKPDQRQYAEKYGIRVIPTQVFLDKDGKEFYRHEGFFPETEIDKLLQKRGLKVRSGG